MTANEPGSAGSANPYQTPSAPSGSPPPNYLWQSIAVTVCCCIPLGIPAIVFASQVNSKWNAGDHHGSAESSRKAKMWCWIAFGVGIVANLIGAAIQFAALSAQNY